jgi:anti-anti-sigma regulatory factor
VIAANVESISTAYYLELSPSGKAMEHRELKRSVLAALDQGQQRIVVDCSQWAELDLNALSTLVSCARVCGQRGVEFDVANLGSNMRATIHALRLGSRLGLVE